MEYVGILKDYGLKATPQRLCVLRILAKHKHPTIDELLEEIRSEYPSISLATVYKNLNTLIEQGIVIEINSGKKARFDIYEKPHFHCICEKCGHVMDVGMDDGVMQEFQNQIEKRISNLAKKINIVVTTEDCEHCR